jgi:hypothetical protein
MAASKSPRARLLHIRDEIDGVAMIVRGLSFAQYQGSYLHRRAVERVVARHRDGALRRLMTGSSGGSGIPRR